MNTRLFFTKIDNIYDRAAEINAGKNVEVEVNRYSKKPQRKSKIRRYQ